MALRPSSCSANSAAPVSLATARWSCASAAHSEEIRLAKEEADSSNRGKRLVFLTDENTCFLRPFVFLLESAGDVAVLPVAALDPVDPATIGP